MSSEVSNQFKSRWGFVFAAMGSAIGLGNIWRYPSVAYENGGGAFLIPYLVALLTAGIPIILLEFALGNKYRVAAPEAFKKISPKIEFIGWWQIIICFFVPIFYSAVIGWIALYLFNAFTLGWGSDPSDFFYNTVLNLGDVPTSAISLGSINITIAVIVFIIWASVLVILRRGVADGIEKVNKFMIPTLLIMFSIVVIYSTTLPGALTGLDSFFKPQWDKISNPDIWLAAYSQIFFSLSIASGVMITYASYTPDKSDINTNGLLTGFGNSAIEIIAGIGVFGALGFLAQANGVGISDVATSGPGLVFAIYPQILNQLPPIIANIVAVLFYLSLFFAAFSSLLSLAESVIAGLLAKFNFSRNFAVNAVVGTLTVLSLLITTQSGLYILDIIDHFVSNIAWIFAGLVEIVVVVFIFRKLKELNLHANERSSIKIPYVLQLTFLCISSILLAYFLFQGLYKTITVGYGDYPNSLLFFYGWGVIVVFIVGSIGMSLVKSREGDVK